MWAKFRDVNMVAALTRKQGNARGSWVPLYW